MINKSGPSLSLADRSAKMFSCLFVVHFGVPTVHLNYNMYSNFIFVSLSCVMYDVTLGS